MYISPQKINEFLILLENHSDSLISTQEAYDQGLKLVQVVERLRSHSPSIPMNDPPHESIYLESTSNKDNSFTEIEDEL
jgi:hypothetical protein